MKRIILIISLLLSAYLVKAQEITIYRQYASEGCTSGYLYVDGNLICYTLELPWRDNIGYISSIPKGTYKATIRYDKKDQWRIQLLGVPNRNGIQIHIGNYTSEIQGCVLVGSSVNVDGCSVGGSGTAYEAMKLACYFSSGAEITVTFK
jgi:hypothetical protein